jgi:hypothetical protein
MQTWRRSDNDTMQTSMKHDDRKLEGLPGDVPESDIDIGLRMLKRSMDGFAVRFCFLAFDSCNPT